MEGMRISDKLHLFLKSRFLMARYSQEANFAPNRYISGILHSGSHQASPIQAAKFSERLHIVPPEVLSGPNVGNRALSPKSLIFIYFSS